MSGQKASQKASWVLNAVVNAVLDEPNGDGGKSGGSGAFIAAPKWLGRRPGYIFTLGDKGLG